MIIIKDRLNKIKDILIVINSILLIFISYKLITFEFEPVIIVKEEIRDKEDMELDLSNNETIPIDTKEEDIVYTVYITGEVENPGVYDIEAGKRISHVLEMAGGCTTDADLDKINLSHYVKDALHIKIPKFGEIIEDIVDEIEEETKEKSTNTSFPEKPAYTGIVNINTDNLERLTSLPGIGNTIGQNIIDYRSNNGGFKSIEEIQNVSRIGEATFKQIKDKITVE